MRCFMSKLAAVPIVARRHVSEDKPVVPRTGVEGGERPDIAASQRQIIFFTYEIFARSMKCANARRFTVG
jgi:hypothetical protein